MKKVYIETYGCWLNKADSSIIIQSFLSRGYRLTNSVEDSEIVVLNTCAVREDSEIRQLKRMRYLYQKYPDKTYIIAGCLAKVKISEILRIFNNRCVIVDPNNVENFDKIIEDIEKGVFNIYLSNDRKMEILPEYNPDIHGHIHVVPLQVGCLCSCTFCVTKFARDVKGKVKSYPIDKIVENVKKAVERGAREIYLTGQDVACYGFDRGVTLVDLLERILREVEGVYYIRIGMSEPEAFSKIVDQLLDIVKNDDRIYKYFHLPVQSGSDRVLERMRRKYTVDEYRELIRKIRREIPECTIVTDIIVGFPGETDEDFELSIKLVEELEFDKVHVARFSLRPFTEAELMPDKIPDPIKKERSRKLVEVCNRVSLRRNMKFIGKTFKGIVSTPEVKGSGCVVRIHNYKPVIVKNIDRKYLSSIVDVYIKDANYINLIGDVNSIVLPPSVLPKIETSEILVEDAS